METAKFTFDNSDQTADYSEYSGQIVNVGSPVWNTQGEPMTDHEANIQRFATGDILRIVKASDGHTLYAWESELEFIPQTA